MSRLIKDSLTSTATEFQERVNTSTPRNVSTSHTGRPVQVTRQRPKKPDWPVFYLTESLDGRTKELEASDKSLLDRPADLKKVSIRFPSRLSAEGDIAVIGEAKRKRVFDPFYLVLTKDNDGRRVKNTLGQMMMYCRFSDTRYGFVFNSENVTFFRFFSLNTKKGYGAHYAVLPWKYEKGKMFACKGIWALVMLSLHDKHRPIVAQDQICDLNTWSRFEEKDGKILWANHISKIIIEDGKYAEKFRVVESSRNEFAEQLDKYQEEASPETRSVRPRAFRITKNVCEQPVKRRRAA